MNLRRTGALIALLAGVSLAGCSGGEKPGGDGDTADGGTTGGGTTDGGTTDGGSTGGGSTGGGTTGGGTTDGGATGGSDTGPEYLLGLYGAQGSADVVPGLAYSGTESVYLIADEGDGEVVCQVSYDLNSTGLRDDCEECICAEDDCGSFAFDLEVSGVHVTAESGPGCEALGLDEAALAELEGSTLSYGYNGDYFGHAAVLIWEDPKLGWTVVAFAELDPETGAFTYNWERGYYEYR